MSFLKYLSIKRYLPRSLFARSLLIITAPIILTMIISTYIFFDRHWERMAGRLAFAVAGEITFITDQFEKNYFQNEIYDLSDSSFNYMQMNFKFVPNGLIELDPVFYTGRSDIIKKFLARELNRQLKHPYRIIVDVEEKWTQVQVQVDKGALIFTIPQSRLFSTSGYIFLFWMIGVSAILLAVAVLFMRNQIRPIKRLAIAAERFGKGRDVPFFKPEGAREVRQAARAFIGMRQRINRQIQNRTEMLAGVSHDLRTPLTRMKLQAEMMGDNADAKALKSDVLDMERMINAYLQFAQGEGNEEMERVDVVEMLNRLSKNFARQDFIVEVSSKNEKSDIFLRPVAVERCFTNILSNAQKYAKNAWVSVAANDENIEIVVDDDGKGIAPELYDDVFKPFFREEKSRNSKTGGVGLGLPIAQDIILAHGGEISLDKSPKGGLRVIINLPV